MSIIIRQITHVISVYLGPKYIKLPVTEKDVQETVEGFYDAFKFHQVTLMLIIYIYGIELYRAICIDIYV